MTDSSSFFALPEPLRDRYANFTRSEVNLGFFDAFGTANGGKFNLVKCLSRDDLVDCPQRSLHNAARYAEDDAGAGGIAEHIVEILVGQPNEINAGAYLII